MPQLLHLKLTNDRLKLPSPNEKHWAYHFFKPITAILFFTTISAVTVNAQNLFQLVNGTNPLLGMSASSLNSNIRFVDIDGDGDQDGFVGQANGAIEFFENAGSKTLPAFQNNGYMSIGAPNGSSNLTFGDLDGDGDQDVFIGDETGILIYYENTGNKFNPSFTLSLSNPLNGVNEGNYSSAYLVDIDCDGDLDCFIGNENGEIFYYENVGNANSPNFVKQIGAANPLNGVTVTGRSYFAFADADGDGDEDCLIGAGDGTIKVYANEGTAMFPLFVEYPNYSIIFTAGYGANAAPEWIDMNGDGDFDLMVGEDGGQFEYLHNIYYFLCGSYVAQVGLANPLNNVQPTLGNASSATFCDVDGDGDKDAILGSLNLGLFYYENTGDPENPVFTYVGGTLDAASPFFGMSFGSTTMPYATDIDGDGDCDIFVGRANGTVDFLINNGGGSFSLMTTLDAGNPLQGVDIGQRSAPTFGDIDGDGDLDCFIGEQNGTVLYFRNDGNVINPVFTPVIGPANPLNTISVIQNATPALIDYDNDGDLDCFVGRTNFASTGAIIGYENQGNANTPFMVKLIGADNPFDGFSVDLNPTIVFVDLDKNGMPDVFLGGNSGYLDFFLGSGCTVLPVEIAYFNAHAERQTSVLDWMTATEQNNEGFYVERSVDGKNWESLGFVTGAGTTDEAQFYNYIDKTPLAGSNYYRLKQVDFNGDFEYSDVRVVEFEGKKVSVDIYPNPVHDFININIEGEQQDIMVSIYTVSGQLVRQESLTEMNNQVNLSELNGGLYFIKIESDDLNVYQKIIKQ